MRILPILLILLAQMAFVQSAKAAESAWFDGEFAKMRLISASETAGASGTLSLGLEIVLDEGWKTYWRTPGDAGLPAQIMLDPIAMSGAEAVLHYPLPKRFSLFDLDTFGYANRVILPVDLTLGAAFQATNIVLTAEALVCADICVPIAGELKLSLAEGPLVASIYGQELAKIRAQLPKQKRDALALYQAPAAYDANGQGHLVARLSEASDVVDILVEGLEGASFAAPVQQLDGSYLIKHIGGSSKPAIGERMTLTIDDGAIGYETSVQVQAASGLPDIEGQNLSAASLPYWLIALIGGFILNFMPCVLPVLSLKVASVLSLGGTAPARIRARFLMSAAGIIASFGLLALFLQILRAFGGQVGWQVGWGIQFQSPVFLGALLIVTGIFTLSLFGVVHLRMPAFIQARLPRQRQEGHSLWGDFGAGMLATILATPCSAPFVGTAISFALVQSDAVLYAMMVMMGIGLALPWLILAGFPSLMSFLPRPGAWMVRLQKGLGVLMALTVLWIGSLFYNAISHNAQDAGYDANSAWSVFDEATLAQLRRQGQLVFVDVTADWCITCKANKSLVLDTKAVEALFADNEVVLMRADWTLPDEAIARYLASNERFGIPFNVVYGKSAQSGIILPEILTRRAIENALLAANQ